MGKIIKKSDFRVVIEPINLHWRGRSQEDREKDDLASCRQIVEQAKRHIDDTGQIYVQWDTKETCSHCGYGWEVDEHGEPLCCQKAIDEFNEQKQVGNPTPC